MNYDTNTPIATTAQTVDALVKQSGRKRGTPLRRTFLQSKVAGETTPGPLAPFVTAGDRTGLLLYLLSVTLATSPPYDVSQPSAVWARALGIPEPNSLTARSRISKTWTRIVDRRLATRSRRGRNAEFTLLLENGSGDPYTRPTGTDRYLQLPREFWTEGPTDSRRWYEALTLPEMAFLLIALSNADHFQLPAERGPDYYGISADTLQRGSQGLYKNGLLKVHSTYQTAPLAPEGYTRVNVYSLRPPFGSRQTVSGDTSSTA